MLGAVRPDLRLKCLEFQNEGCVRPIRLFLHIAANPRHVWREQLRASDHHNVNVSGSFQHQVSVRRKPSESGVEWCCAYVWYPRSHCGEMVELEGAESRKRCTLGRPQVSIKMDQR